MGSKQKDLQAESGADFDAVELADDLASLWKGNKHTTREAGWTSTKEMAQTWGIGEEAARKRLMGMLDRGIVERRHVLDEGVRMFVWRKCAEH